MKRDIHQLAATALAALALAACADGDDLTGGGSSYKTGKAIAYNIDLTQDWYAEEPATRAVMEQSMPRDLRMEGSGGTAWLQETTRSGIDSRPGTTPDATTEAATRAALVETQGAMSPFGSFCFKANGSAYYTNVRCSNTGQLEEEQVWPAGESLSFYALHPYGAGTTAATAQSLTCAFTVNADVAAQKDLMYAATGTLAYNEDGLAPLTFKHALTAVSFSLGANPDFNKTITAVTLKNVYTTGTLTVTSADGGTGTWINLKNKADITLSGLNVEATEDRANTAITSATQHFLMIPQELDGVGIEFTFSDGTALSTTLSGGSWLPGTTRNYALSMQQVSWEYQLTVSSPSVVNYTDTQTGEYTILSYRYVDGTTTQQPVAWEVTKYEYSDDNGATWTDNGTTKPAWLTALSLSESGDGGTEAASGTATIDADSYITDRKAERDNQLKNAEAKTDCDLSDGKETANCYVISAPGTYKIPLIYGNMRGSSGSITRACLGNTTALQATFVDYKGTNLYTQNKMEIQGITSSTTASLVWSDESENIVSNLAVDVTNNFLTFTVSKENLEQGNAVVGIKNADGYLWSWHLWFAPSDALGTIEVTNHQNTKYNFTKETLGWKYTEWIGTTYETPRQVRITVRQTKGDKTATITIVQNNGAVKDGISTLYQFGRKDAMPGTDTFYPSGGFNPSGTGKKDYATAIKTPGTFYNYNTGNYDWCSTTYNNAWSANNTVVTANDNAVVKTVYDPCPVGFHLPASNAFTGFTTTGGNTTTASQFNVDGSFDKGWNFWTNSSKNTTIYFPASGYRSNSNGTLSLVGTYGGSWSAIPTSALYGRTLGFLSGGVYPLGGSHRVYARSVRPVQ